VSSEELSDVEGIEKSKDKILKNEEEASAKAESVEQNEIETDKVDKKAVKNVEKLP
jgi:hypothetical protein